LFVNAKAWEMPPAFEWKPDPLPNQVQNLLDDLDGFAAAPDDSRKRNWRS